MPSAWSSKVHNVPAEVIEKGKQTVRASDLRVGVRGQYGSGSWQRAGLSLVMVWLGHSWGGQRILFYLKTKRKDGCQWKGTEATVGLSKAPAS